MLRTTNIWPIIMEWKNKNHVIPFYFGLIKIKSTHQRGLDLGEGARLPQCGEPKFDS